MLRRFARRSFKLSCISTAQRHWGEYYVARWGCNISAFDSTASSSTTLHVVGSSFSPRCGPNPIHQNRASSFSTSLQREHVRWGLLSPYVSNRRSGMSWVAIFSRSSSRSLSSPTALFPLLLLLLVIEAHRVERCGWSRGH